MVAAPRLENVLKRAEELEGMQKVPAALDALYETVTSKRTRSMSVEQLEPVFAKFVTLAVKLRRGKVVKDGLHQYKKLVLSAAADDEGVVALTTAVGALLSQSEAAVSRAQQQAEEVQVDDLEEESPQDLLLAMVSSEEARDRTDREVVTPWLKFLWENYRSVLDVLRNNSKLETAYADVASQAFGFCQRYGRKTEFRRLTELLRTHLQHAATQSKAYHADMAAARAKAAEQAGTKDVTAAQIAMHMPPHAPQSPIDLSDGDTLQRFLDTRFEQLDVAVKLELWQEAFRSVEDVHTLLSATRRPIPVSSMSTYYETLARVFAVSQNHLFHAATWFRYFVMLASRRAPEAELRRIASFAVLSLLCVPRGEPPIPVTGRLRRWMALINLQRCPTREDLIEAVLARNVLSYARPELRALFVLFEQEFNPLTFRESLARLAPQLEAVAEFAPYFKPLLEVAATTVFNELATAYTEARLDFVLQLVELPAPFTAPRAELERLLVRGSAQHGYRVRIDHQRGVVRFVDSLAYPLAGTAGALVRSELYDLARLLAQTPGAAQRARVASPTDANAALIQENTAYLQRLARTRERGQVAKVERMRTEEEQQRERARAAEEERLAAEAKAAAEEQQRAQAALEKQRAEIALAEKRALAESINAKGHLRVDMDKLEEMTMEQLQSMQVEQLDQEAKSLDSRMAVVARRYDHLERALRREEARFWAADAEQQAQRDRDAHERRAEALRTGARRAFDVARAYADRLGRVRADYDTFTRSVRAAHDERVAALRAKNSQLLEAAKAERRAKHAEAARAEAERRRADEEREAAQRKIDEERRAVEDARRAAEEQRREEARRRAEQVRAEIAAERAQQQQPPPPSAAGSGKYQPPALGAARRAPPRDSPFGASAGSPADASRGAPPVRSPFGRSAGAPADAAAPRREAYVSPAARGAPPILPPSAGSRAPGSGAPGDDKPKRFVPPHLRK